MAKEATSVADIFRRAQAIRAENKNASYKEIKERLVSEFSGKDFPSFDKLTIPEMDGRAPEEDWTAGLPIVRRGIQNSDWKELMQGIIISLEQVENYEREHGAENSKEWHDRSKGIEKELDKTLGKWMPDELKALVEKAKR
jgi:hypothetical protein